MAAAAFIAASVLAPAAYADTFDIDGQHAWVTFTLKHGIYGIAHGQFDNVSGSIVMDKADPAKSSVKASIDVGSIHTAFDQRDSDLKGPDFFNAAEFPAITFESTKVEKVDDTTGKLTGNLTISGTSKEVMLDVKLLNEAPAPWDATLTKAAFRATTKLSIADFPMAKAAEGFGLGPDVDVIIDIEAVKK
ncbi:polyisoprenoid-binding protein [Mesorhizobium sp. M4A.F.Ca.ET.020.02.1.1]|uniref:YceI family protein n=1 Tax=unclassified Mesorhizobium TaxID=325217 RepID=UPI000FD32580|nr:MULTISPECIES: YceI family protein [unclassified Mesorhizobium]RVD38156.1 polyisoprenoid-binding protein [Mesorhizobium sp. M4A.F.Ca.ET.020.02.1.1]RWC17079.1 MAG: polyisoprenoid-binding protein [Mesorhizobium sp.]